MGTNPGDLKKGKKKVISKEELKAEVEKKLMEEAQPPVEDLGNEEEVKEPEEFGEGLSPSVLRPEWEEFLRLWDRSPAVMLEAGVYAVLSAKFDIPPEALESSRLVPALAYVPAWYLWPYLSSASEEQVPPAFRPLVKSLAVLVTVALVQKAKEGSGGVEVAGEGVPPSE